MGLDDTMRALADPTRREILRCLRERDMTAGEIGALFPIAAASTSHHLSVLKAVGLVSAARDGRSIVYSLNATVFQELMAEMLEYFGVGGER